MFTATAAAPSAKLLQQASETLKLYERNRRERPEEFPKPALSRQTARSAAVPGVPALRAPTTPSPTKPNPFCPPAPTPPHSRPPQCRPPQPQLEAATSQPIPPPAPDVAYAGSAADSDPAAAQPAPSHGIALRCPTPVYTPPVTQRLKLWRWPSPHTPRSVPPLGCSPSLPSCFVSPSGPTKTASELITPQLPDHAARHDWAKGGGSVPPAFSDATLSPPTPGKTPQICSALATSCTPLTHQPRLSSASLSHTPPNSSTSTAPSAFSSLTITPILADVPSPSGVQCTTPAGAPPATNLLSLSLRPPQHAPAALAQTPPVHSDTSFNLSAMSNLHPPCDTATTAGMHALQPPPTPASGVEVVGTVLKYSAARPAESAEPIPALPHTLSSSTVQCSRPVPASEENTRLPPLPMLTPGDCAAALSAGAASLPALQPPGEIPTQANKRLYEGVAEMPENVQKLALSSVSVLDLSAKASTTDAVRPQSASQFASQGEEPPVSAADTHGAVANMSSPAVDASGHRTKGDTPLNALAHTVRNEAMLPALAGTAGLPARGDASSKPTRVSGGGLPELPAFGPWHTTSAGPWLPGGIGESSKSPTCSVRSTKRVCCDSTHGWRMPRRRRPPGSLPRLLPLKNSTFPKDVSLAELDAASALLDLTVSPVDTLSPIAPLSEVDDAPCMRSRCILRPQVAPHLRCMSCNATSRLNEPVGHATTKGDGSLSEWINGWWELRVEWKDLGSCGALGPSHGDVRVARYASLLAALESLKGTLQQARASGALGRILSWSVPQPLRIWRAKGSGEPTGADFRIAQELCSESWYVAPGRGGVHRDDVIWEAAAWVPGSWRFLAQPHHLDAQVRVVG